MSTADRGGDAPCWAHILHEPAETPPDVAVADAGLVVDLASAPTGSGGAIWSLPHGGDLDANLVRLDPGQTIAAHVNDDVDVVLLVRSGAGRVTINQHPHLVEADHLLLIPNGAQRSIGAGPAGITYLSIHARRDPLRIGHRDGNRR